MEKVLQMIVVLKSYKTISFLISDYPPLPRMVRLFKTTFVLYDCMEYPYVGKTKIDRENAKANHVRYIQKSDAVFVNSRAVKDLCLPYADKNRIISIPSGFVLRKYFSASRAQCPGMMAVIPKPIAGFVGFTYIRLDIDLLFEVVTKNPNISFVFIGPKQTEFSHFSNTSDRYAAYFYKKWDIFIHLPNVYVLHEIDKTRIASYVRYFDIGIIPYDIRQKPVLYANAIKAYEYMSLGKRVIATNLLPLADFYPYIDFARSGDEFSRMLQKRLKETPSKNERLRMRAAALRHDVSHKAKAMTRAMDRLIRL
jgi:hypothetical protein